MEGQSTRPRVVREVSEGTGRGGRGGLGGWVGGDICVCLKGKWVYIQQNKWFEF